MHNVHYDPKLKIVSLTLSGTEFYEDFKQAWLKTLDLLHQCQSCRLLIDARRHKAIPFEGQVWFKETFLKEASNALAKDVKVAKIASKRQDSRREILALLLYMRKYNYLFNIQVFEEHQDAVEWLLEPIKESQQS